MEKFCQYRGPDCHSSPEEGFPRPWGLRRPGLGTELQASRLALWAISPVSLVSLLWLGHLPSSWPAERRLSPDSDASRRLKVRVHIALGGAQQGKVGQN